MASEVEWREQETTTVMNTKSTIVIASYDENQISTSARFQMIVELQNTANYNNKEDLSYVDRLKLVFISLSS